MNDKWIKRGIWGWGGVVVGTLIAMILAMNQQQSVLANTYSMMANTYFGLLIAFIILQKLYHAFRRPTAAPQQ